MSGELERWFPGPERGGLHCDGRQLLSVGATGQGLRAWDLDSGEQTAFESESRAGRLLALRAGRLLVLRAGRLCTSTGP